MLKKRRPTHRDRRVALKRLSYKERRRIQRDEVRFHTVWYRRMFKRAYQEHLQDEDERCRRDPRYQYWPGWPNSVVAWVIRL